MENGERYDMSGPATYQEPGEITVRRKTVPLSEMLFAMVEQYTGGVGDGTVMIHRDSRCRGSRHHLKLYSGNGRWYVRVGRRGGCRKYLTACEITYLDGKPILFQFKTE